MADFNEATERSERVAGHECQLMCRQEVGAELTEPSRGQWQQPLHGGPTSGKGV